VVACLALAAGTWVAAAPAFAAKVQLGDSTGGGTPEPIEGSELEISFNPLVSVKVQSGETLGSLLDRLVLGINQSGAPEYYAQLLDHLSFEVWRTDGSEIDDLRFRERDPAIQDVTLSMGRSGLTAMVVVSAEPAGGGQVIVTLNDRAVTVDTQEGTTATALAEALAEAIRLAGFAAELSAPVILVRGDLQTGGGVSLVGWRSTDPALHASDLALLPDAAGYPNGPVVYQTASVAVLMGAAAGLALARRRAGMRRGAVGKARAAGSGRR
jgi:hypothetical protein